MSEPVALVTGGAQRIGRAIVCDLADHGWAVAIHYHASKDQAEALAAEIRRAGGRAVALACDLSREVEVRELVPRAAEALGPLTCLVNNASVFEMDKIDTATRESWDRHIETNLRAPLVLSQAFAGQLPDDTEGNIVNMLDQRVWKLTPYFLSYTIAKSGLWTLTQTMAMALAPRIRVNGIGPGPTLPSARQTIDQFKQQQAAVPLKRGPTPEEIAATVRFILGTPSMTGQMIALDGGEHLGWAQPGRGFVARE
jgi:NAD(P)-dependent dehydrogenase (short-subunit alcohol dehydrogenase family)